MDGTMEAILLIFYLLLHQCIIRKLEFRSYMEDVNMKETFMQFSASKLDKVVAIDSYYQSVKQWLDKYLLTFLIVLSHNSTDSTNQGMRVYDC